MKRNFLFILLSLVYCLCISITATACGSSDEKGNKNNNRQPPVVDQDKDVSAPYIISFGSYLSWDKVVAATEYEVYCNNSLIEIVKERTFQLSEIVNDSEFYLIAKNSTKRSQKSNTVMVSKNSDFTTSEILDLSNSSSFNGTIDSSIRKVVFKNSATISFKANLSERSTDITFELNNVNLKGYISTDDKSYSRIQHNYNVILNINNECNIEADAGSSFPNNLPDDTEIDGIDGSDGDSAVVVPTLIIRGNGNLTLKGGNGGNGCNGSSTTTWSSKTIGKGSNGGNGGAGIKTQYFILDLENSNCTINVINGKGGSKGSPGTNGSLITGPLVSAMWSDVYDIGKNGSNGESIFGVKTIIKGNLVY